MQIGLFDEERRLEKLSEKGDSLEKLNQVIEWETFRPILEKAVPRSNGKKGGRPPFDHILMLKILILKRIYNLGDDALEYQILDRLSWMRFLGLHSIKEVPDAKTIWLFQDMLSKTDAGRELFMAFNRQMEEAHLITHTGTIVDATFVDAPRQHNTREENAKVKEGEVPQEWDKPEQKAKRSQKDTDAWWSRKYGEMHYGYKDHIKADRDNKLIRDYVVTAANVGDGPVMPEMIDADDHNLYADSAYCGKNTKSESLRKMAEDGKLCINEQQFRNRRLTEEQKRNNRIYAKIRCRVEHIFGFMSGAMHGLTLRTIGMQRAKHQIAMLNLTYNLCRYVYLKRILPAEG